jgi:hypothetical protein
VNALPAADLFPIRVHRDERGWLVDWCRLGERRFTDPFFEETVRRCRADPINAEMREPTNLDELPEEDANRLPLSGLIFHLSRCGSTLVSQSFATGEETVVISEAAPIDDVLRAPDVTDAWRIGRLRAIASALGRKRRRAERHLVVKLDAWHALSIPLVERAFPGVPWFFVYRDPVEIMVSHQRSASRFLSPVNAPSLFGIELADAVQMPPEEYRACILARICQSVAGFNPTPAQLVSYTELPGAIERRIAPAFGIELGPQARLAVRFDAKRPEREFVADGEEKRRSASPAIEEAVRRVVAGPYARLEALRTASQDNPHPASVTNG